MSRSFDIGQLAALAERGVPEAKMMLSMRRHAVQNQDEQDRRWRNMAHGVKQLKDQGKEPQTCQEHLDAMARYGFDPVHPLSAAQRAQKMRFDQFAAACGGFTTREDYPAKGEPDAPAKCEGCSKQGAALRCSWCGEWYCSKTCFIKDMRDHKQVCVTAVANMHCGMPPTPRPELWSGQQYAKVFGITSHAAGSSSSAAKHPVARSSGSDAGTTADSSSKGTANSSTAQQQKSAMGAVGGLGAAFAALAVAGKGGAHPSHGGKTKTQKRNAKRREKQKQERALAAAVTGGDVGAKDELD